MNNNFNVTMLEELPDLEDINDQNNDILPPEEIERMRKYTKQNYIPPPESGMTFSPPQSHLERGLTGQPSQTQLISPIRHLPSQIEPTCLQISDHIQNCPICMKLYKNDNTVYIIIIIVLVTVIMILLNKILYI